MSNEKQEAVIPSRKTKDAMIEEGVAMASRLCDTTLAECPPVETVMLISWAAIEKSERSAFLEARAKRVGQPQLPVGWRWACMGDLLSASRGIGQSVSGADLSEVAAAAWKSERADRRFGALARSLRAMCRQASSEGYSAIEVMSEIEAAIGLLEGDDS